MRVASALSSQEGLPTAGQPVPGSLPACLSAPDSASSRTATVHLTPKRWLFPDGPPWQLPCWLAQLIEPNELWGASEVQHVRREAVLAFCALLLIPLAVYLPADRGDAVDATQFTVAFFATLLTGEAVIFALTFSAASSWPSLRAIDSHIAFREWVFIGWVAAMFTACGLLSKSATSLTYGALLFILANVFGVFSFIRLFGLASIGGRNRLLRQTLTEALPGPRPQVLLDDPVVAAYLGALDQAISTNDPTGIRNLVGQLVDAEVEPRSHDSSVVLRLEVLHRLARATLVRGADPVVVVGCAES